MTQEEIGTLIREALRMRAFSYVPYSHFAVGAALLTRDGKVFTGCNIENKAFGSTICAERTAIFKAVSEGYRDFRGIVITGGPADALPVEFCPPCGACRQVMAEFAGPDFEVVLAVSETDYRVYPFKEILPLVFDLI